MEGQFHCSSYDSCSTETYVHLFSILPHCAQVHIDYLPIHGAKKWTGRRFAVHFDDTDEAHGVAARQQLGPAGLLVKPFHAHLTLQGVRHGVCWRKNQWLEGPRGRIWSTSGNYRAMKVVLQCISILVRPYLVTVSWIWGILAWSVVSPRLGSATGRTSNCYRPYQLSVIRRGGG